MNLQQLEQAKQLADQLRGLNHQIEEVNAAEELQSVISIKGFMLSGGTAFTIRNPASVEALLRKVYEQLRDERDAIAQQLIDLGVSPEV